MLTLASPVRLTINPSKMIPSKKTELPQRASNSAQELRRQSLLKEKLQAEKGGPDPRGKDSYGKKKKILLLVLLVVALSGYNIWLIVHSFYAPAGGGLNIRQITTPLANSPFEGKWFDGVQDQNIHHRILAFKSFMDSLSRSKTGRSEYDRIMASRPGLMDSLLLYENTYQLQATMPTNPSGQITNPKN